MYENTVESIIKAQKGDKEELEKLINENNGLIWSIVKRFNGRGHELEDLYQIGCIGFIKSIKRFDTSFEVKLSTYSVPYILGEIKRFIRDDGPIKVSRSIKELNVKINELKKHYLIKEGREITLSEISQELNVSKEDIAMAIESSGGIESIDSMTYENNNDGSNINLIERISTGKDEQELVVNKLTIRKLMDGLENKEKQVILLRFYKEKTQSQVAKILGITQVQVSRIERKILNNMKAKLIS
ncbi:MAG: SigB/SigF/SigG family RNA polymerase sigma factor [Clostridia bacterium]|nr:SigB/SigF/SigG family RNA polymerase sigma factor [Clostridia bacterium]